MKTIYIIFTLILSIFLLSACDIPTQNDANIKDINVNSAEYLDTVVTVSGTAHNTIMWCTNDTIDSSTLLYNPHMTLKDDEGYWVYVVTKRSFDEGQRYTVTGVLESGEEAPNLGCVFVFEK